jgi:hypothetical protein
MPLVAIIWAAMWRRMQIVTTAELITLRYGGKVALLARKVYALLGFCYAVIIISYITGFFPKTVAPLIPFSEAKILLIFGGVTAIYTVFGGLIGVVFTDVIQFFILFLGNFIFLLIAIPQHDGWQAIAERAQLHRPEALQQFPPTSLIPALTVAMLVLQGLFFSGSPTAGEGMTAQRFMGARSERHAIGGQLFNSFLALSLRTVPLIGLGLVALSLFWTKDLIGQVGVAPPGFRLLQDPAYAWGELVNLSRLPAGFKGVLVAAGTLEKDQDKSRTFHGRRTEYRPSRSQLPPRHRLLFGADGHDQLSVRRRLGAFYRRRLGVRPVRVLAYQEDICG